VTGMDGITPHDGPVLAPMSVSSEAASSLAVDGAALPSGTVTIAGPGNDAFMFKPSLGSEGATDVAGAHPFATNNFSYFLSHLNELATVQPFPHIVDGEFHTMSSLSTHDSVGVGVVHGLFSSLAGHPPIIG
jgi:hypothetical protein